jgi:hypothetical protein
VLSQSGVSVFPASNGSWRVPSSLKGKKLEWVTVGIAAWKKCWSFQQRLYGHSKDCYYALGVEWTSAQSKIPGASCDEIIMAKEHRKSLMLLV